MSRRYYKLAIRKGAFTEAPLMEPGGARAFKRLDRPHGVLLLAFLPLPFDTLAYIVAPYQALGAIGFLPPVSR